MRHQKNSQLWEYLEAQGILEQGTEEEIKAAKRAYRKRYLNSYKQKQRAAQKEFTVTLSIQKGEYRRVKLAAVAHHRTITSFIRSAVFAYLDQKYLVPNPDQLARLEQILSDCLNEVQHLVTAREKYGWERERKLEAIEERIIRLEKEVQAIFISPPKMQDDCQNQISKTA